MLKKSLLALPVALAVGGAAQLASAAEPYEVLQGVLDAHPDSLYLHQSPQNVQMMPDNPAMWVVEEGGSLFRTPMGPNNVSLESCDFGKGPGVLEGAYVELPRYFEDTGRVMDFESRLVHCMKTIQGFADDAPEVTQRHGDTLIMKLSTYVAAQSNGMAWNPPLDHPLEQAFRAAGEELYFRIAGTHDFNCATCHSAAGKRIRASYLPSANRDYEWTKSISWPAFRVGHDAVRSSQHRVRECMWQMRHADPLPDSDFNVAILTFWTDKARGQPAILPDLKR
ncbi:MAG: sulfur oxidation c-type cytochrome SoxA [Thioalkalivibrionaceae bacterium]